MKTRSKTESVDIQSLKLFSAMESIGGKNLTFREICKKLGTDDLSVYREGLKHLINFGIVIQFGTKKGATYSLTGIDLKDGKSIAPLNADKVIHAAPASPEAYLISIVSDGKGYSSDELTDMLAAKFPEHALLVLSSLIKKACREKKISYEFQQRRYSDEGYRLFFYPPLIPPI